MTSHMPASSITGETHVSEVFVLGCADLHEGLQACKYAGGAMACLSSWVAFLQMEFAGILADVYLCNASYNICFFCDFIFAHSQRFKKSEGSSVQWCEQ